MRFTERILGTIGVRVCLHGMNLAADVDRLLEAMARLVRGV